MTVRSMRLLPLAAAVLLTACGGSPAATTGPGAATAGPVGATAGPNATAAAATAGPLATQAGNGGTGSVDDPCGLLTTGEIESAIGVGGWTSQSFPMNDQSGQCLWSSASGSLVALSISNADGNSQLYDLLTSNATDLTPMPGIGDKAVFMKSTESLVFLKGNLLVTLAAGTGADGFDKRKGFAAALGPLIAGRI